ncbi:amino acid ABC transporter ATP-binding protein [Pantoea coffeiphila]|uniref:amino acid ABC transporter ATP-binding protein n=1 Tax=Pantoea coffeiphila TaxID=1465635 RepID=UPI00195FA543|nr:amino acid ABC transporter ATP-binding protein [Pantoea coffeiphila]MBM7342091.1 polar amino acid transport system ATP-binding protein [Pantoea coffeiphila]
MIELRNIHKSFGGQPVLRGIDLRIEKGEVVVILGASGSGKSTLLRCMNLLETPDRGEIILNGQPLGKPARDGARRYDDRDLQALREKTGMVFQQFNLFPHLTVERNITVAQTHILRRSASEAKSIAEHYLAKVGLADKATSLPTQLSGGQQQRVAIARALAMKPELMLFDEATSALDPELVGEVLNTIKGLRDEGMTMAIVTHELGFAWHVADRIVFLRDGTIYEQGTPDEILLHPSLPHTQRFLASHTTFTLPTT